jgi:predicted transcriptional regulator
VESSTNRSAAGLKRQDLATPASTCQETLSRIESGKHTPTMTTLKMIDPVLAKNPVRVGSVMSSVR